MNTDLTTKIPLKEHIKNIKKTGCTNILTINNKQLIP